MDDAIPDATADGDHGPFALRAGVPVMSLKFTNNEDGSTAGGNSTRFPAYHTGMDTYEMYSRQVKCCKVNMPRHLCK